jgi:hypothetical protein
VIPSLPIELWYIVFDYLRIDDVTILAIPLSKYLHPSQRSSLYQEVTIKTLEALVLLLTAVEDSNRRVDAARKDWAQDQGLLEITEGRGSDCSVDDNTEKPLGDLVRSIILDYTEPNDESDDSALETLYAPLGLLLDSLPNLKRFKCNYSSQCIRYIEYFDFTQLTHISIPYLNHPEQLTLLSKFPLLEELELYYDGFFLEREDLLTWEQTFQPLSLKRLSFDLSSNGEPIPLSLNFLRSINASIVHLTASAYHLIACVDALSSSVTSLTLSTNGEFNDDPVRLDPSTFTRFSQLQHFRLQSSHSCIWLPSNFFTLLLATPTITSLSIAVEESPRSIIWGLLTALRSTSPLHVKSIHLDLVARKGVDWVGTYEFQHYLTRSIIRARDLGIELYGLAVDEHLNLSKSGKLMMDDPKEHEEHWTIWKTSAWLDHESWIFYMKCFFLFEETQSKVGSDCATSIEEL